MTRRRGRDGPWTYRQAAKNFILYGLVRATLLATRPLPPVALRALGRALGALAFLLLPGPRAVALQNLARVFTTSAPRARWTLAFRAYLTLGGFLGDAVASLRRGSVALPVGAGNGLAFPEDARAVMDAARAEGRGVVFASAHLGPWERVAATLVAAGVPLTVVARESYDPRLDHLYGRLRGGRGMPVVYRGAHGSGARIFKALRSGRVLGIPMDLRSRVPSVDATFLGHPAPTAVGPARLALRAGAAVVVGAATRDGAISMVRVPTADLPATDAGERALTGRINDALSARILAYPEAWPWMHPRFAPLDLSPS